MAFIRIKTIQNKRYAYIVKNVWSKRKKCSKQKVMRYLGPIISIDIESYMAFSEYYRINDLDEYLKLFPSSRIFKKMLALELINHGFRASGSRFIKDDIEVSLSIKKVERKGKPVVLEMNEGFLCSYTLTKLYNFKVKSFDIKKEGMHFANTILQSGIQMDEDVFIHLFNKIYKKG